jgi:putative sugar O-methyltransferase
MPHPSSHREPRVPSPSTAPADRHSSPFDTPSRFWQELGAEHARDLDAYGFEEVKRRQALRYFSWQWRRSALRRSEQFRFLVRRSSPLTVAACAAAPVDLSDEAWRDVPWDRRDRWLHVFAVRLLWEYARRHDPLGVTRLAEPALGGPLPVRWRRRLVSQDLANSALEIEAVARALGGEQPDSIIEIGAGYGRMGYALLSVFPSASYTVVDIEPARSISEWYLTRLFPERALRFLAPEDARALPTGTASLALSISTLQEMTPDQVKTYLHLIDRVAAGGTVYLKQWARWHNPVDDVTMRFADYPFPRRWSRRFDEAAPVQTGFRQAAFSVPAGDPTLEGHGGAINPSR